MNTVLCEDVPVSWRSSFCTASSIRDATLIVTWILNGEKKKINEKAGCYKGKERGVGGEETNKIMIKRMADWLKQGLRSGMERRRGGGGGGGGAFRRPLRHLVQSVTEARMIDTDNPPPPPNPPSPSFSPLPPALSADAAARVAPCEPSAGDGGLAAIVQPRKRGRARIVPHKNSCADFTPFQL